MIEGKRVLLVISGGIAAYKCLELIRRLRERDCAVRCILTKGGENFVTPLSLASLSGDSVYREMFSLTEEREIGHINLGRETDLVVVAPATANLMAKMAMGVADDLATTTLLATDKPILLAPAMNVRMWEHDATRVNLRILSTRGVRTVGPEEGPMACNEYGFGRMAEPEDILAAIEGLLTAGARLTGRRALVTSGPTFEAIDPVRYIANRSSGKQGHAVADALARMGAETVLVTGPTHEPDPTGVTVVRIETAEQMLTACRQALPADIAVCAAAVSDWRAATPAAEKMKKNADATPPAFKLVANPDVLATLAAAGKDRPSLVVGFAAETESVVANAIAKRAAKGCDWIVANDVSAAAGTFGGDANTVHLITADNEVEDWPLMSKKAVAERLTMRIADVLEAAS